MLAGQDGLEAFFHQLLPGPGNCVDAGVQRGGDPAVTPSFAGSEASAFNRMRALTNWPARCLPLWISVLSRSRVIGAKVRATAHFSLAPIRGGGFFASCAAAAPRTFR